MSNRDQVSASGVIAIYHVGVVTDSDHEDYDRSSTSTVEGVLAMVRQRGGRITGPRRLLLEAVFATTKHQTAEELAAIVQARAPDVALSTIYRNLEELEKLGVVLHAHLGHGPATYHLTEAAHGHLVCESCGAVIEVSDGLFSDLSQSAESQFGFDIDPHHFAVLGRCRRCR